MLRMRANKSVVRRGTSGKRIRIEKAKECFSTVTDMLEPSSIVQRKCYTCEALIECNTQPMAILGGPVIVPRFNAPLICRECRKDKQKFDLARKAMLKFFGWSASQVGK